jgi:hypothetical protein
MPRLKESYAPHEVNDLLVGMDAPTPDDASVTADGRRLDSSDDVMAFFDEIRAKRASSPSTGG